MIAADSGFVCALVGRRDAWHARAAAQAGTAAEGWITTWPVLAEVGHLFHRRLSPRQANALMDDGADGLLMVWDLPRALYHRIPALMQQYANLPMDLADASLLLLLLAEQLGHGGILSTDERDFETYCWKRHQPFDKLLAA